MAKYIVGPKIKEYLDSRGIKYKFVAQKIGMRYPAFSERLNGNIEVTAEELYNIAAAVDASLDAFVPGGERNVS